MTDQTIETIDDALETLPVPVKDKIHEIARLAGPWVGLAGIAVTVFISAVPTAVVAPVLGAWVLIREIISRWAS